MERYFKLAGTVVRVTCDARDMFTDAGNLTRFEVSPQPFGREIQLEQVDALAPPEGEAVFIDPGRWVYRKGDTVISYIGAVRESLDGAYIRILRKGCSSFAQIKRSHQIKQITSKVVLQAMEAENLVVSGGGFLLHSACICVDGMAILFTAPSGTGKSTQADLWERLRGAEIINGDRIVVRRGSDGFQAEGIPFSGSSGICKNKIMPLRAIVYLSQAKQTSIERLGGVAAFRRIWEGCSLHTWNSADVCRCSETVMDAAANVSVYHLACTPDESAILALESQLGK